MLLSFGNMFRPALRANIVSQCNHCTVFRSKRCVGKFAVASRDGAATPQDDKVTTFRAAIDFKAVLDNIEGVKSNVQNRQSAADVGKIVELYSQFTALGRQTDALRQARNENAAAMKGKMEQEQREELKAKGQKIKEDLAVFESRLRDLEASLQFEAQQLPNMTHPDVVVGGEEDAVLMRQIGAKPEFNFEAKNHVDLMEELDLIDFETASGVSGSKFYYLRNAGALLELALVNMAMQKCIAKGYTATMTPDLVRGAVLEKCGFQPRMANTQTYSVRDSDLCLTGTAEVPLGGFYMDRIIEEKDLPIRMAGFGHCFRTEAGAGGMAGKGLYRVHQFSKVEMFVISTPEQSESLLNEVLAIEEDIFTELGLHYKVIDMPSGDLGAPAYRKFDIEAWMPGLARYGEISSASNCTDYQARRLNIRYRQAAKEAQEMAGEAPNKKRKKQKSSPTAFCHTLNATACAVPRMIIAIVENFQREDGSIEVPPALRPYLGGLEVISGPL
jgi:seryl-tRNA synthetase